MFSFLEVVLLTYRFVSTCEQTEMHLMAWLKSFFKPTVAINGGQWCVSLSRD